MDDAHSFKLTSSDGTKLHARHWAAKTPHATLALVHGFGEHCGRYTPMATHLNAAEVDVFAVDLRGHGQSDGKRGVIKNYDDFRADLAALLDHARTQHKTGPLVLYGHSMGGGIVLDHGLRPMPAVDGIIASAPLIEPAETIGGFQRRLISGLARLFPKAAVKNKIDGRQISTLPAEQAEYERDALNHSQLGLRTAVDMVEVGEALTRKASDWSIPLLMLHSTGDQLTDFTASRAFGQTAKADFRQFSGVEHEMHNDTTRMEIYRTMTDFIDRLSGRA